MLRLRQLLLAITATTICTAATFAQAPDTSLIKDLRHFFFEQTGFTPDKELFTKSDNKPYYILYISLPGSLDRPRGLSREIDDISLSDSVAIAKALKACDSLGFETMLYDVPADAGGSIRPEFSAYSNEGLAFLVFHELMHNFIRENHYSMPYLFEEAICDVTGEFATLEFGKQDTRIDVVAAMRQLQVNDSIYDAVNAAISAIFMQPDSGDEAAATCDLKVKKYLNSGNSFQKFRFGYKVNNAFLLKARNYSWDYFICKQLYFEKPSVAAFSEAVCQIADQCTSRPADVERYREKLFANTAWQVIVHTPADSTAAIMTQAGQVRFVVTKFDPLQVFQSLLEENCSPDEIDEGVCRIYWNIAIESLLKRSKNTILHDTLCGADYFGKAWLVSSSFIMDGHIACWMEPAELFMGKTITYMLSRENTTLINTEDRSRTGK